MSIAINEADLAMAWTQLPPGPELGIRLALVDWSALPDRELVAAMEASRRQAGWAQGLQLEAVGELSRRRYETASSRGSETHRRIAGEVSIELTIPTGQAEELLMLAEILPETLPCTWAALRSGQIDYDRAKVMAEGVAGLSDELARRLDADLIGDAVECTKTLLRHRMKRAVKAADPAAFADRTKEARDERRVEVWDNADDTCDLVGRNMDAADAHAIVNRLTAAATAMRADGDGRPIDQIRLDLYRDLLRGIPLPEAVQHLSTSEPVPQPADGGAVPTCRGAGGSADLATASIAMVERLIAAALADTADEQLTRLLDHARAAERLDGLQLLISQATQTMRDALTGLVDTWCRATGGDPARHGHAGYRPPAAMQRLVQRRHPTCGYPTCNRRSTRCDLDHTVPYGQGGRTCTCNLAPLCRTHHRIMKQHPQWTLVQPWPGLLIWVTPSGTWHIVTPQ